MADNDGIPPKMYVGKRGPRKSKPRKGPVRDAVVTELFGEKAADEAEERRPKKAMPGTDNRPTSDVKASGKRRKVYLGQRWSDALVRIEAEGMTMAQFCNELSPEELARGQLKAPDGTFSGPPVKWVPAEFHKACIRELMNRGKTLYQESYLTAIQTMLTIANNPIVEPAQRIKAAQFVIERIEGKVPDRLEVSASEPWQELLVGILADVPAGEGAPPMREFAPTPGGGEVEE